MRLKLLKFSTVILFLLSQGLFAQQTITGMVNDETGSPLPGANAIVKGSTKGTQTDFDGQFILQDISKGDVIVISYVGFKSVEIPIVNQTTISVQLEVDNSLDEVVVVGYSSTSKETISSAVTVVDSESIEARPNGSFAQALQATSPGLNISTGNGQPGGNSVILLRGVTSISGNTEPLFVIDGIPVDEDNFRSINPNDIESAVVLKDAAATAIYGNRATGGVIIIKTKRGNFESKSTIRVSSQSGITRTQPTDLNLANSAELLEIERRAGVAVGGGVFDSYIQSQVGVEPGAPLTNAEIQRVAQTNTDWFDVMVRDGFFQNHNISFSGGSENLSSLTSLGYYEQEGLTRKSKLQRMTVRNNTDYKKNGFRLASSISVGFSRTDIPSGIRDGNTSGALDNPFIVPYVAKPYLSAYNSDGSLNLFGNPNPDDNAGFLNTPYITLNSSEFDTDIEQEIKAVGSLNLSQKLGDNFTIGGQFGMDYTNEVFTFIQPPTNSIRGINANDPSAEFQGSQQEGLSEDARLNLQANLGYNKTFGDYHNVSANLYTEFIYSELSGFNYAQTGLIPGLAGNGAGFVSGQTTEDPNDDGVLDYFYIPTVGSFKFLLSQFSYFGRFSYDYNARFGADVSIRRDASSRFNRSNKWGTFGAASAFWNLSREGFLENSNVISNLKLRASYGVTGNDRITGGYYGGLTNTFDLFNTGQAYNGSVGLAPSQIANEDVEWESTTQANVGIDFGFANNRLTGTLDFYNRETENVFLQIPNTAISGGFTSISGNLGTLSNKGVEIALNWNAINSEDFKLNFFANASYNKNEIESLPGSEPNQYGEVILNDGERAVEAVGNPFNTFYVVRWAGVNPNDGTPLYLDRDGDLTSEYDLANRVLTDKSSLPTYQGGFGSDISYKGFALSTQWSFAEDVWRNNGDLGVAEDPTLIGIANVSKSVLRAWNTPGQITDIPSLNSGAVRNLLTDRYLEDASYLRLRNAVFSYTLDDNVSTNLGLDRLRLFVQGENILTFTKWRGADPEFNPFSTNSFFGYPNASVYTLGIDLTF